MKKLPLHPAFIVAPIGVAFLIGAVGGIINLSFFPVMFLWSLPAAIGWAVLQTIFLYQLWVLAQASDLNIKKPTPGKAIGFWFIPFFGFYWTFILWRNLALHLNHLTRQQKTPVLLVIVGCGLFIASFFSGLLLNPLGFAVEVIFLIINFYFYRAAKEICGSSDVERPDEEPVVSGA